MELREGYKQTEVGPIPKAWTVDQIKNHCDIKTGGGNTQDRVKDGAYPFFVRSQTVERINSYTFDGEAVLTAGDGVGTGKVFHYINGKFDCHQRVYRMSNFSDKLDGYYFYLYFSNNFYGRISQMTAKSSVDSVRMEMIADMNIPLPPTKAEQSAIATTLSDVDALITQLEKLITKKRQIKQGAMQTLLNPFDKNGKLKGGWKLKPLPEVIWYQEGPGLRNWQFTKTGIKVINVTNLQYSGVLDLDKTDRHISINELEKMYKHFLIDSGDFVMASSGNSYCKSSVVRDQDLPLLMNTSVIRFKPLKGICKNYMVEYLKSKWFKEQIDLLITGGAQPNFGPAHLNQIIIPITPTEDEQEKSAATLLDISSEISALEEKLEKTRKLKQGMMQSLLTGQIRLVGPSSKSEQ